MESGGAATFFDSAHDIDLGLSGRTEDAAVFGFPADVEFDELSAFDGVIGVLRAVVAVEVKRFCLFSGGRGGVAEGEDFGDVDDVVMFNGWGFLGVGANRFFIVLKWGWKHY